MRSTGNKITSNIGFIGIIIAISAIFFIVPLLISSHYAHIVLQICFALILLCTIYNFSDRQWTLLWGLVVGVPFFVFDLLSLFHDSLFLMMIAYCFCTVFIGFSIIIFARKLLDAPSINTNLICGAITVYLLVGVMWAKLFYIVDLMRPGSFHGITSVSMLTDSLGVGYDTQFNLLYYSYITLTTLGIGDITPLHPLARSLTVLEVIIGQLFLATVITKLVAVWSTSSNKSIQ